MQQLLANRFTGELQDRSKLRDGRRALLLERNEDRAPAVGKLVDGENDAGS
ncbi:MAG TPA: hypothetical protein VII75_04575 [Thermoanaerobaculia bacterium]|nr:hypothetical protein [Thermoanaerobaculia bacterium]